MKKMKKLTAILLSVLMAFAFFGCKAKEVEPTITEPITETTTEAPKPTNFNPLTGQEDYNEKAIGIRPVAIVVENLKPARPQWGITTPDIIVEGEVEGGISRMLWLYADYTSVPSKVGPLRSARPSYVKFSRYFDAIFIHWGGSHSKAGYTGGYETIRKLKIDDIDGMAGGKLFGRDKTRSTSSEHRGILDGSLIAETIKNKKFRTAIDENNFTRFEFNDEISDIGESGADKVNVTFSNRTDTRKFTYNTEDKLYHTKDWEEDVAFENVIILMAKSTYYTTPYKGSSTTYLNYAVKNGGTGYLVSNGTSMKIKWASESEETNKLVITDEAGNTIKLNKGKSYIGLASSNHEGKVSIKSAAE